MDKSTSIAIGDISANQGEINIAGGAIHKGYTAEQVAVLLDQIKTQFQPRPFDGRCPYKGLDAFEEEDSGLFFGREQASADLAGRLRQARALFICGPSGSGKSSLVRAGLLPALKQGAAAGLHSQSWLYAAFKPGRDPLAALAAAVSRLKTPELGAYLRQHAAQPAALLECLETALSDRADQRALLFIDQFEEIFTQVPHEAERQTFLDLVTHAASAPGGRGVVLFAMRSDFIPNCAAYPQLNALLNQQFVQIGAMQPAELVNAIAQPALRVGLRIDPDLITQIISDMQGEPGALPLMQFALKDLFDAQQAAGGVIALTLAAYLQRGGVRKSLERHADAAFSRLGEGEQQLARAIFGGLVEIGRGVQDTRRTALFNELVPPQAAAAQVQAVVAKLADARLITTDQQGDSETVALAHEKLIEAWPWLQKLVNENRDAFALQNEIHADAKEWAEQRRDPSYLYTGGRLANVLEQLEHKKISLGGTAGEFIQAGRLRRHRAQRAQIAGVLAVIVTLVAALIIFKGQSDANGQLAGQNALIANTAQAANTLAVGNQVTAQANANEAKRQAGLAQAASTLAVGNQATAQAASTLAVGNQATAQANADEAKRQERIALARQLAAEAQALNLLGNSRQMVGVLLAVRSMQMLPSSEASQVLQASLLPRQVARIAHIDAVNTVAFSPDGKYVVSASNDSTARVWEAATGKEMFRLTHAKAVISADFSPNGKTILTRSRDNTVRVWDAASGKEISRMTHNGDSIYTAAFAPDSRYVVSGGVDKTARVWEAANGKEITRKTFTTAVTSAVFSHNGRYVASSNDDHSIVVWEAAGGREIMRATHGSPDESSTYPLVFSPDDRYLVSGSAFGRAFSVNTARVWEIASGKEIARMTQEGNIASLVFSPDGKYVASASYDKTARVWEAATGREVARMTHDGPVGTLAFSPDGRYVISGSGYIGFNMDGTARVWEALTGKEVARMTHDAAVLSVAFSPDGKYVVSGSADKTVRVWETSSGAELSRKTLPTEPTELVFSQDGKYTAARTYTAHKLDSTALVWETGSGKIVAQPAHDDYILALAISPDGRLVATGSNDQTARVWETASGKELLRLTHTGQVVAVAFSPDGRRLATGSWDKNARVWDTASGKEIARVGLPNPVKALAYSPDGSYLLISDGVTLRVWDAGGAGEITRISPTGGNLLNSITLSPDGRLVATASNNNVKLWQWTSGKEIASFAQDAYTAALAFSPDGQYIAAVSGNQARVWQISSGKEIARVAHDSYVTTLAFSPDSKYLASGSGDQLGGSDNSVRVWEIASGKEVARVIHGNSVNFLTFSKDGKAIISASDDRTVRTWLWRPEDLIAQACARLSRNLTYAEWTQYLSSELFQAVCPNLPAGTSPLTILPTLKP